MTSATLNLTLGREQGCFLSPQCLNGCRTRPTSNSIRIHDTTLKEKVHCQEKDKQKESEEERDSETEKNNMIYQV